MKRRQFASKKTYIGGCLTIFSNKDVNDCLDNIKMFECIFSLYVRMKLEMKRVPGSGSGSVRSGCFQDPDPDPYKINVCTRIRIRIRMKSKFKFFKISY